MAPLPRTVTLNGRNYVVDFDGYQSRSQEGLRDGVVTSNEPGDSLFNADGAWTRYKYSWHRGAGQEFDDLREDADIFRFHDSHMINPWNEGRLTLQSELVQALSGLVTPFLLSSSSGYAFASSGTSLYRSGNGSSWTAVTAPGGTIRGLASDGYTLYVATSTTLTRYVGTATTVTAFAAPPGATDGVWFVAGKLLCATANVLSEVSTTGALTTIKTHFQGNFVWTTAFAIGSRIYVGGYASTRSELYTLAVDGTGTISLGSEAANLAAGELLYQAKANAGVAVFCTSKGARLAQVGGDGTLTYGPAIEIAGCYDVAFEGRFAWVTGHRLVDGQSFAGTVRLALDVFTDTLKPAYAWDAVAGGNTTCRAVQRFDDSTNFFLASGLLYHSRDYWPSTTTGWLDSGRIYMGTVEPKYLTELTYQMMDLLTGESVVLLVETSRSDQYNSSSGTVGAYQTSADLLTALQAAADGPATWFRIRATLNGTGSGPTLYQWRLRAYPVPPAVTQWVVPLVLAERVVRGGGAGRAVAMDVLAEKQAIQALFTSKAPVNYVEGDQTYRVRVDAFEFKPSEWEDQGKAFNGICTVRLVTV